MLLKYKFMELLLFLLIYSFIDPKQHLQKILFYFIIIIYKQ